MFDVIIDCYTDEPSGLGAPPYLSVHSRYLSGVLSMLGKEHYYLTIDDIRASNGEGIKCSNQHALNKRVINITTNSASSHMLMRDAAHIYVVFGCFVKYNYVSCEPPTLDELSFFLNCYKDKTVLFYCLGSNKVPDYLSQLLKTKFNAVYYGKVYNYFIDFEHPFATNYSVLSKIAPLSAGLLKQIQRPLVIEIETMSGCNHKPGCSFCIESIRNNPLEFRLELDIINEMKELYSNGTRYFRLGMQPNFYAYELKRSICELLSGIRKSCPELKMLHIDNVNPVDVVKDNDLHITNAIIKYCTSGNIAPFGIESFDNGVRKNCRLNGSVYDILNATQKINALGSSRVEGDLPHFLPGYNFIYGLDGQNENSLKENLESLAIVMENGWLVRRTFVRRLTSSFGQTFNDHNICETDYQYWCKQIENSFSLPMLKRIYPLGMIIKDARVEMITDKYSLLRVFGTCAERIIIKSKFLELDTIHNVKIIGYIDHRSLLGEIV